MSKKFIVNLYLNHTLSQWENKLFLVSKHYPIKATKLWTAYTTPYLLQVCHVGDSWPLGGNPKLSEDIKEKRNCPIYWRQSHQLRSYLFLFIVGCIRTSISFIVTFICNVLHGNMYILFDAWYLFFFSCLMYSYIFLLHDHMTAYLQHSKLWLAY